MIEENVSQSEEQSELEGTSTRRKAEKEKKSGSVGKTFIFKGKLVVVGDIAVGKTSVVSRFIDNKFLKDQRSSIGVAYSTKTITVDSTKTVKLDLWDTAGQERFRSISSLFYRGAGAALIVYDITDRKSFTTAQTFWLKQLRQYAVRHAIIALAGNKSDLEGRRQVPRAEARAFAEREGLIYLETSAKSGRNISQIFGAIAREVPKHLESGGFKVVGVDQGPRDLIRSDEPRPDGCGC
jgi:Ras-related protein Rab-5C